MRTNKQGKDTRPTGLVSFFPSINLIKPQSLYLANGLFQRPGKLVGTGSRLVPAGDPLQAGNRLVYIHTLDQAGHALGIAAASAYKFYIFYDIIFYVYPDKLGTDAVGSIIHIVPPEKNYVFVRIQYITELP